MFHEKIKSLFSSAIQSVDSSIADYAVNPEKDFVRRKKFPADKLMTFLVSQGSSSTENELLDFFDMDTEKPTVSAFNQQRAKLKPEALEAVFHKFNDSVDLLEKSSGYRYLAADGSTVTYFSKPAFSPSEYFVEPGHSPVQTLWDEMYLSGNGKIVDAKIHVGNEWQDTKMSREYPYGYGENLQFVYEREENADNRKIEVYAAEYTVDVSKNFRLEEELKATVTQEYFLEKDSNTLIQIDTNLTDLNEKLFIANDISANGATLDTAQNNMEKETGLSEVVTLEIFNGNGDILIEIP